MPNVANLFLWAAFFLGQTQPPPIPADVFAPAELSKIQSETDVRDRIKIYEAVSTRYQRMLQADVKDETGEALARDLAGWGALIKLSLEDIEAHADRRRKWRELIRYEIHLRKAVAEMTDAQVAAGSSHAEEFSAWLKLAENARRRFVAILFPS